MTSPRADWWMPFYVSDYLADTRGLTASQHGAYLLLLMEYWVNGPLPDDDSRLATITLSTPSEWRKLRPVLLSFFKQRGGRWRQKRMDAEIKTAIAAHARRKAASDVAIKERWKHKSRVITLHPPKKQ